MTHRRLGTAAVLLLITFTGAAGCKSKFTRDRMETLKLGEATPAAARVALGAPYSTDEVTEGSTRRETFLYVADGNPFQQEGARLSYLEFLNAKLIAFSFFGFGEGDQSRFPAEAAKDLESKRPTRDQVRAMLGRPAGMGRPGTQAGDFRDAFKPGVAEVWQYLQGDFVRGRIKVRQLLVAFNAGGVVQSASTREMTRDAR